VATQELQKLEDVFQFGFITLSEYTERKKAICELHNIPFEDGILFFFPFIFSISIFLLTKYN
jgi:hypothetical protein